MSEDQQDDSLSVAERVYILKSKFIRLNHMYPEISIPDTQDLNTLEYLHTRVTQKIQEEQTEYKEKIMQKYRELICEYLHLDIDAREIVQQGKLDKLIFLSTPAQSSASECMIL